MRPSIIPPAFSALCQISALCVFVGLFSGIAWAQDNCPDIGNAGTQSLVLSAVKSDGACAVIDQSYAKQGVAYKVHIDANSSGGCQIRLQQGFPNWICVDGTYYPRALGATKLYDSTFSPTTYFGIVQPSNFSNIMHIDTTVPTGTISTGAPWSTVLYPTLGEHIITSDTNVNGTPCNLTPLHFPAAQPLRVNVLKCEPKFWNRHLAPPGAGNKIQLYLPTPAMDGAFTALDNARNSWNARASGTGIEFEIVRTPCGSGPACVTIQTGSPGACGFTDGTPDPVTQEITGNASITLDTAWASFTADGRERTFVHELGHLLGLDNYADSPTCTVPDAAMQRQFACQASSVMHDVTVNDSIPVNSSVYGGNTKSTCGF